MVTEKKRIPKGSGRDKILRAATELFLDHGFEATSPQAIYAKSGVGQGSFYYHFNSKIALMDCVLEGICTTIEQELVEITAETDDPWQRIELYLARRLRGTKGCRLGRFIYEDTSNSKEVSKHIDGYLKLIRGFLSENLLATQHKQQISQKLSADSLADLIITQIQGAYVLSRMQRDGNLLQKKLEDLKVILVE